MRSFLLLPLLVLPSPAFAQSPDEDEKRIEEIVRERYGPTQAEIDALALQGLAPDGRPLIDPLTGLPVVPGEPQVVTVAPVAATAEVAEPALPPPDLPAVGPITFEDLSKLVGYWVKLRTYNGATWQGQVKSVKGNVVQIDIQQRGLSAKMTLKKTAIERLERI